MAQQVNDWKQKIHQLVADLIKGMEDGLNMNEDLSNKQVSTSTSDVCTSSARDKEAARKGKQAMELKDIKEESDEEYFDNFSKKFQR
jgi:ribosomal protein L12E/L44/L45/RPP1/RPP2